MPTTCGVSVSIDEQSADIALGVDKSLRSKGTATHDPFELTGAGDQGMMFGYALSRNRTSSCRCRSCSRTI